MFIISIPAPHCCHQSADFTAIITRFVGVLSQCCQESLKKMGVYWIPGGCQCGFFPTFFKASLREPVKKKGGKFHTWVRIFHTFFFLFDGFPYSKQFKEVENTLGFISGARPLILPGLGPALGAHHGPAPAVPGADPRRQLGAAQAGLHRGPAGGAGRPSGVSELLCLVNNGCIQS